MSIPEGTILRMVVSLLWTDGNVMQNVFNAIVTGAGGPWDDDDIVEDAVSWAEDLYYNLTARVSDEVDGSQVQVYEFDPGDVDWDEVGAQSFFWNPTNDAEELPRGVAGLINLKSIDPDVSGKKYIGGLTEGNAIAGLWEVNTLASMLSFGVDWYAPFVGTDSGADWNPGIWSTKGPVFKLAGTTLIIPSIPAYQRRRKRGIGI